MFSRLAVLSYLTFNAVAFPSQNAYPAGPVPAQVAPVQIRKEQFELMGRNRFVERIAEMLVKSEAVDPATDRDLLRAKVAEALDEAEGHGIRTERLMGMYAILRIADKVAPYDVPEYAKILRDPSLEEADKAHLIQMIRIDAL